MLQGNKIVVVMPAYNAEQTLRTTHDEVMAQGVVDEVVVVDDASSDATVAIARSLPNTFVHTHPTNQGYGANQKTCYRLALGREADIVIMVHPDYQYTPKLIPAMASMIASGLYDCVLGSRILGGYALEGGMPLWRYVANRFLTLVQNILIGAKLSEYHTGYRAYSRTLLETLSLDGNSDDFLFDNQMLTQIIWHGQRPRSASPTASGTASAAWPPRSSTGWPGWVSSRVDCFRTERSTSAFGTATYPRRAPRPRPR
jgi:glycosyltransferase involved in cell wall biosynthesis